MNREDRLVGILDLLAETGSLEVADVISSFGVSPATARRDLDALAERALVVRTHGGASVQRVAYDLPLRYKKQQAADAKSAIAAVAVGLIEPGMSVGFTGGTTCTAIAEEFMRHQDLVEAEPTIVTNAINIASALLMRPQLRLVVTGGVVNPSSYELAGSFAEPVLTQVQVDIAFIGVNAFDVRRGPTIHDPVEARVNMLMASRAERAWVVADSTKIGRRAFTAVGPSHEIAGLVTDDGITDAERDALEAAGWEVRVASW